MSLASVTEIRRSLENHWFPALHLGELESPKQGPLFTHVCVFLAQLRLGHCVSQGEVIVFCPLLPHVGPRRKVAWLSTSNLENGVGLR